VPSSFEHLPSTLTGTLPEGRIAPGDRRLDGDLPLSKSNGSASTRKGKKRRRPPGPRVPNDRDQPRDDLDGDELGSSR
jgi:hypothetical protein